MIKAILFDLDGTLLQYSWDVFTKEYLKLLSARMAHLVEPGVLARQIISSTVTMMNNMDPAKTNKEVFVEDFFPKVGVAPEIMMPVFDDFYERDFPKLRYCVKPDTGARRVVQKAFDLGLDVVIATNPVFPIKAIRERLSWGNIEDFEYRLVTSYETMHFCKPTKEYYFEILERIEHIPQECLMVGNDIGEDMVAGRFGIKTFLVEDYLQNGLNADHKPDYSETFAGLVELMTTGKIKELLGISGPTRNHRHDQDHGRVKTYGCVQVQKL